MKYTVYPVGACRPAEQTNAERLENPFDSCKEAQGARVLLQSPYGGKSLQSFIPPAMADYVPFMESWANLFEGLDKLHYGNYAHLDIKPPNIVSGQATTTEDYHTRYIDFGLGVQINALPYMPPWKTLVYATPYVVWPYETRFLCSAFQKSHITAASVDEFIHNVFRYRAEFVPAGIYGNAERKITYTVDDALEIWNMYQALPTDDRYRHIAMATDVYSLGLALATIYAGITGHFGGFGDNIHFLYYSDFKNPLEFGNHPHRDTTFWEPRMGSRAYAWHLEVAEEVSIPFYAMCRQMMAPLPFHRPEAADALKTFNQILPNIRRLFDARGRREGFMMEALTVFFNGFETPTQGSSPTPSVRISAKSVPEQPTPTAPPSRPFSTDNVPEQPTPTAPPSRPFSTDNAPEQPASAKRSRRSV
jgi:serine/threonine protein kinase